MGLVCAMAAGRSQGAQRWGGVDVAVTNKCLRLDGEAVVWMDMSGCDFKREGVEVKVLLCSILCSIW